MVTLENIYGKYLTDPEEFRNRLESLHEADSISYTITKIGGIGDSLQVLPVIRAIEAEWEITQGCFVLDESLPMRKLFSDESFSVIEVSKGKGFEGFRNNRRRIKQATSDRPDLYIDLTQSLRSFYLGCFSGAKLKLGYKWHGVHKWFLDAAVDRSCTKFEGDTFLDVIRMIGLDRAIEKPSFSPPEASRSDYERWLKQCRLSSDDPFLLINPGARTADKRWDIEKWPPLLEGLDRTFDGQYVLLEGPAERGIAEEIKSDLSMTLSDRVVKNVNRPLGEVAHLTNEASGVITNDTYLLHMGITLGSPTFCIFNGKDPFRYRMDKPPHDYVYNLKTAKPSVERAENNINRWMKNNFC